MSKPKTMMATVQSTLLVCWVGLHFLELLFLGVEESLYLLLSESDDMDINARNNDDKSALFYARTPKMVHLMSLLKKTDLWAEASIKETNFKKGKGSSSDNETSKEQSALESLLRTNGECAKALLATAISTNGKEQMDKDLLLIYDLKLLINKVICLDTIKPQPSIFISGPRI